MMPLRAAVVGAGHLGRFHAEKYAGLPDVRLAAIVDVDPARARQVAGASGAQVLTDHRALAERVDVASVAVPTSAHYPIVRDLLDAGIHVLVEKPLAASVDEGRDLVDRSARCGRVLQVGHIERFNPVVRDLLERVGRPLFIECQRVAPFNPRGTDTDVVLDLMIHDIDLLLQLVRSPIVGIDAHGLAVLTPHCDIAQAWLRFADGCVATLNASRIADRRERRLRLFQDDAYFSADLGGHALSVRRKQADIGGRESVVEQRIVFADRDPLADEIRAFVGSVSRGDAPQVSASDGMRAVATALEIGRHITRWTARPS